MATKYYKVVLEFKDGKTKSLYEGYDEAEYQKSWALPIPKNAKQKIDYSRTEINIPFKLKSIISL